jgi:hypothetical protein
LKITNAVAAFPAVGYYFFKPLFLKGMLSFIDGFFPSNCQQKVQGSCRLDTESKDKLPKSCKINESHPENIGGKCVNHFSTHNTLHRPYRVGSRARYPACIAGAFSYGVKILDVH